MCYQLQQQLLRKTVGKKECTSTMFLRYCTDWFILIEKKREKITKRPEIELVHRWQNFWQLFLKKSNSLCSL